MKLRAIAVGAVVLMGLSGVVFASEFMPAERIHCMVNEVGKLSCEINHEVLVEHTYTADMPVGKEVVFNFAGAVAYFANQKDGALDWSILYTYVDTKFKNVTLRTVNTTIKPNLQSGTWKRFKNEYYYCNQGYMSCTSII